MMNFTTFLQELFIIILIALTATGVTFFWRTCIYSRGGIFRFIGRILDKWVENGTRRSAKWYNKLLRFLAYPLGRCVFCSGFHFTYEVFFLVLWGFNMSLNLWWLLILLPMSHIMITIYDKHYCTNNSSLEKSDWDSLLKELEIKDARIRAENCPTCLTKAEEDALDRAKG